MIFPPINTLVASTTATFTYSDLDLSSFVGTNYAWVQLKAVRNSPCTMQANMIRPNGTTIGGAQIPTAGMSSAGIGSCFNFPTNRPYVVISTVTDANGVIEHRCENATGCNVTYYLEAYDLISSSTALMTCGTSTSSPCFTQKAPTEYGDWLFTTAIVIFMLSFITWGYFASIFKKRKNDTY